MKKTPQEKPANTEANPPQQRTNLKMAFQGIGILSVVFALGYGFCAMVQAMPNREEQAKAKAERRQALHDERFASLVMSEKDVFVRFTSNRGNDVLHERVEQLIQERGVQHIKSVAFDISHDNYYGESYALVLLNK